MRNTHPVLILLLLLAAVAGCQSTPLERYEAASIVYVRTLQGVQLAAAAGKIDDDDLAEIEPFRAAVRAALDEAKRIIDETGTLTEADARVFDAALNAWLDAMLARQGIRVDPETGAVVAEDGRRDAAPTVEQEEDAPTPTTGDTDGH